MNTDKIAASGLDQDTLWREFSSLSVDEKVEVVDFIAFLQSKHKRIRSHKAKKKDSILDEPFLGMWKDRQDMADSTAWVRAIRKSEWTRHHA